MEERSPEAEQDRLDPFLWRHSEGTQDPSPPGDADKSRYAAPIYRLVMDFSPREATLESLSGAGVRLSVRDSWTGI